jgi:hypothetical protein
VRAGGLSTAQLRADDVAEIELFLRGDQIATYTGLTTQGNSNGTQVNLSGVQTLGSENDVFRIVVRQVNSGDELMKNGQFVDIYSWPDGTLVVSGLNPQHDQFQGRASSHSHQIFTAPSGYIFDINGITGSTVQYGPGFDPPLSSQLAFSSLYSSPPTVPCFTAGTRILTGSGLRLIESLSVGDTIWTQDHGLQPLRWIGRRTVCGLGALAPVELSQGAFGNTRALRVSPQHRVLIDGWQNQLFFGEAETFVAARHLVDGKRARFVPCEDVEYLHLALDRHEVICAEGLLSESLHLGAMALASMTAAAQLELMTIFPELSVRGRITQQISRRCLSGREARLLAA